MSIKAIFRTLVTAGRGLAVGLPEAAEESDPIDLFGKWYQGAIDSGIFLPESMALATSGAHGMPSARMVLLKGFDAAGFVFFTNYGSRKAAELEKNPQAALLMHWAALQRQVRIEGSVRKLSPEESRAYFSTRSRSSRLGAWVSQQSAVLTDKRMLVARLRKFERQFKGGDVPCPPFWGGFRVAPERIEFWQGRPGRLHDRLVFTMINDAWTTQRLYP